MSFTAEVKKEVCQTDITNTASISELSALLRNIGKLTKKQITILIENKDVAGHLNDLIIKTYGIRPIIIVRKGYNFSKNFVYVLEIKKKVNIIKLDLALDKNIPDTYIYNDNDQLKAYLKGLFLATGSVNDPKTSRYHLEFVVDNKKYARFASSLLNSFYLNSKIIERDHKYMIYIKEAEKIGDFFRIINANEAVMYYEDVRIYRDHINMTNRLNNCEQANVDKQVLAATEQLNDINYLQASDAYPFLDDKLKEVSLYRQKYPDVSLVELSEIISLETGHTITKSGLYHRFCNLKKIANKIRNKQ